MMKKATVVLVLLFMHLTGASQSFEGVLEYKMDLELLDFAKERGITKEQLLEKMAEENSWSEQMKISYKNGNYRVDPVGEGMPYVIYRSDSNQIYTVREGDAQTSYLAQSGDHDLEASMWGMTPTTTLLDSTYLYEGVELKIVEVKWKSGSYYYAFDENRFQVDPELFKGHIYDGLYEYLKIAKSLPIITVKGASMLLNITTTLTNGQAIEVDSSLFDIPDLEIDEKMQPLLPPHIKAFKEAVE